MGLEKISEFKKKLGLTTEELSKQSGVPKGTLDKILSGITKDPKLETLKSLSRVLGCTLDDFDDRDTTTASKIDTKKEKLLNSYDSLNSLGKAEAVKRVDELTFIEIYTEKEHLLPFAAHDKENIDVNSPTYEEDNQHDIDMMMNDDEWK